MHITARSFVLIIVAGLLLSACGGAPATNSISEVETVAAMTFQAMTAQAEVPQATEPPVVESTATNTPESGGTVPTATSQAAAPASTSTPEPPIVPVKIVSRGTFIPYPATDCERVRVVFEQTIGAPVTVESVAFSDRVTGGTGTACRVHGTGTGATYGMAGPSFSTLISMLQDIGWTEDSYNYGAGGATGMATGFKKGGAIGLLHVGWQPSADANCPKDQPIGTCALTPEQKIFDVTFDVADMVVYNPPAPDQCASALTALQPAIPVPFVIETVDFADFEMNRGTACQLRAEGDGTNFANIGDPAKALDAIMQSLGWTLVNGADGPTGTGREYTNGNLVAIVFVTWKPSADANCPKDQPISMCSLTPQQKLYTVKVTFGEK